MNRERWQRIESICFAALDLDGEERGAYLASACGDDEALRREVTRLLARCEEDSDFLARPLARVTPVDQSLPAAEEVRVGNYRLVRPLGVGGMGEVYLAQRESDDFRQAVAVKIIKPGMDTDEVLRRFRLERQILASLQHPNIAHLIDGGATQGGRPYFVMEYVDGRRIDDFCEERQLAVHDRLHLFAVVCGAVQHAHNNLVVHRDLKPGNILVTPDGVPKLLDFGIGKFLTPTPTGDRDVPTRTDTRALTPEYAAPEQVRGEPVTTATDVYGLGVLLYKLLAGVHPYAGGKTSVAEIERAVCDETPPPPSTVVEHAVGSEARDAGSGTAPRNGARLRRRLSGDLDNIVLRALRKEPGRRYASAAAFADDIERHLTGRPVRARPDTIGYRTGKFLRRHAWAVTAAGVTVLALVATSVMSTVQSRRVTAERDQEREVRGFLMEMFGATGAEQPTGDSVTARQLLDLQARRVAESYGDRPELQAEMLEVVADGYDRLGLYAEAEPLALEALTLRRTHQGERHPDVAGSLNLLGWVRHERGRSDEAEPLLREAVAIRRAAGRRYRLDLARSLNDLGVIQERAGDYDEAERLYREALDIRVRQLGESHLSVAVTANNLSAIHYRKGEYALAIELGERTLQTLRRAVGEDHDRTLTVQSNLATFKLVSGDPESAEREYRDLIERHSRVRGRDHPRTASVMTALATVLMNQDRSDEAKALFEEALAAQERALGSSHPVVATTLSRLAGLLADDGELDGAEAALERALDIQRGAFGDTHRSTAETAARLADVRWDRGDRDAAIELQRFAVGAFVEAVGPASAPTRARQYRLCRMLGDAARHEEAVTACGDVHASYLAVRDPSHQDVHWTRLLLARGHLALHHFAVVDSLLAASRPGLEAGEATDRERNLLQRLTEAFATARQ